MDDQVFGESSMTDNLTKEGGMSKELIEAFEKKVKAIPIGSECHQKGASYYNWGNFYLTILKGLCVELKEANQ